MKTLKFTFELDVEVPDEEPEEGDIFNEDYAKQILSNFLQNAVCYPLERQLDLMTDVDNPPSEDLMNYLKEQHKQAKQIANCCRPKTKEKNTKALLLQEIPNE